jgi:uncharacterized iron-regulated membrane protein
MRKALFWTHLAAGSVAGAVILIMSITGVLLAYERQLINWADGNYRSAPAPGAQPLPASALLRAAGDGAPTALTLRSDPLAPAEISIARERTIFVDRYTGAAVGNGSAGARKFFQTVTAWHRWLGAGAENRGLARAVTGACNLAFLLLIVTGPFLWIPKQWTWGRVRPIIWFRGGLQGRARDWNWHHAIGLWTALPLAIVVSCAVFMSYPWANDLLYRATGSAAPAPAAGRGGRPGNNARPLVATPAFDQLWSRAEQQVSGWRSITMRAPASFQLDRGDGGRPDLRAQLTLNPKTAEVVRWEPFSEYNAGRRARSWMRFLHTGEAGGFAGQTIAAIASAGAVVLVWTGIGLAIRRLFRAARKTKQQPEPAEAVSV